MGPAISAYRRALAVTARTPAFTVGVPAVYLLGFVVSVVIGLLPFVGWLAGAVFVAPATAAIALGMAAGALAGDDPIRTGVERLENHYLSMVGAYAVLAIANTLVWIALFALLFLGLLMFGDGAGASAGASAGGGTAASGTSAWLGRAANVAASAVFVALALAVFGALAWGALVLQFVGVAIVVGDDTATSTFGTATALFRTDRRGVVAYSALRVLTGAAALAVALGLFSVGYYGPGWFGATPGGWDPWLLGFGLALLGALVVWPLTVAFLTAYHVAYFSARSTPAGGDQGHSANADAGAHTAGTDAAGADTAGIGADGDQTPPTWDASAESSR